jgi:hypothetical protein
MIAEHNLIKLREAAELIIKSMELNLTQEYRGRLTAQAYKLIEQVISAEAK